jgi:hypothetical protein
MIYYFSDVKFLYENSDHFSSFEKENRLQQHAGDE